MSNCAENAKEIIQVLQPFSAKVSSSIRLLILLGHLYYSGGWSGAVVRTDTKMHVFKATTVVNHYNLNSQHNWCNGR